MANFIPTSKRLFHVSEDPAITIFEPRPSPSAFEKITGDVVFAIAQGLLHNYLLPRDCPRVGFYAGPDTHPRDIERFLGLTTATYVLAIEKNWLPKINESTIFLYEFPVDSFAILDECAGYYISYEAVKPIGLRPIPNILEELLTTETNIELRLVPSLWPLADAVIASTLQFSCIRMRNAAPRENRAPQ